MEKKTLTSFKIKKFSTRINEVAKLFHIYATRMMNFSKVIMSNLADKFDYTFLTC